MKKLLISLSIILALAGCVNPFPWPPGQKYHRRPFQVSGLYCPDGCTMILTISEKRLKKYMEDRSYDELDLDDSMADCIRCIDKQGNECPLFGQ